MLWTDQDFVTTQDLLSIDPLAQDTASNEGMTLEGDNSVCRRGIEEAGKFLERKLTTFSNLSSGGGLSANHLAAVYHTGGISTQRRRYSLEQIVVTGRNAAHWSEIKQWAVHVVLCQLYKTAMNRVSEDKYEKKFERFSKMVREEYWPAVKKIGVPVVLQPLPAPEAVQGSSPGTFSVSAVEAVGATGGRWYVAVSYVDTTKYVSAVVRKNGESNPSLAHSIETAADEGIRVDITNLNPPTGSVSDEAFARGYVVPRLATHWNVYAGSSESDLRLQNAEPIPLATLQYDLDSDPVLTTEPSGLGQYAESFVTIMDTIQRG